MDIATNTSERETAKRLAAELADLNAWRRPNENAAERLTSTAYRITQAQLAHDKAHGT